MSQLTMGEVLDQLMAEDRLDQERRAKAVTVMEQRGVATPWYLRFMVGFGAWWAALFFMGFFTLFTRSRPAALFFGVVLVTGAISLRRLNKGDFLNQIALAAGLAGQLLIVFGTGINEPIGIALLLLLMQGFLIVFYADQTFRLLSTLVAVMAIEVLLYEWKWTHGTAILAGLLGFASIRLWLGETRLIGLGLGRLLRPVAYGLVIAMFGLLLPSIFPTFIDVHNPLFPHVRNLWISAVLLGVALLYLVHVLLTERGLPPYGAFALSCHGAVVLLMWPAQRAPGLIGALIILLLGFRRGNRLLLGMALLFLALFISAYYYNLSMSLLLKSAALAGSGVVLLALRWVLLKQVPYAEVEHAR